MERVKWKRMPEIQEQEQNRFRDIKRNPRVASEKYFKKRARDIKRNDESIYEELPD